MLVLDRRTGEEIVIGSGPDKITVVVIDSSHKHARLGVDAPDHIKIHRKEIADRIANGEPQRRRPRHRVRVVCGKGG